LGQEAVTELQHLVTPEDAMRCEAQLTEMVQAIINRRKQKQKQGRNNKIETARKNYIEGVAIPRLRYLILPTECDMAFLRLKDKLTFGSEHAHPISKADEKALNQWATLYQRDPRSLMKEVREAVKAKECYVQTALVWALDNVPKITTSIHAKPGASPAFKFGDGPGREAHHPAPGAPAFQAQP